MIAKDAAEIIATFCNYAHSTVSMNDMDKFDLRGRSEEIIKSAERLGSVVAALVQINRELVEPYKHFAAGYRARASAARSEHEVQVISNMATALVDAEAFIDKPQWTGCAGDGFGGPCKHFRDSECDRCLLIKKLMESACEGRKLLA